MEFHPMIRGKVYPEFYHIGFTGTHFQCFLSDEVWEYIVNLIGAGSRYAERQGIRFIPPAHGGGVWGFDSSGCTQRTLEGDLCVEVRAVCDTTRTDGVRSGEMGISARTITTLFWGLYHFAFDLSEEYPDGVVLSPGVLPQLFLPATYIADPMVPGGYGIEVTVSPQARKILADHLTTDLTQGSHMMRRHMESIYGEDELTGFSDYDFSIFVRESGMLNFKTLGNCACLGGPPVRDVGAGYCLSSHNVDTSHQQMNLLVGVVYVWQAVRETLLITAPA